MKSVIASITVNVDVEDDATDEEIDNDARGVLIDLLQSGAGVTIVSEALSTDEERRLARLEASFDEEGGRGVELAEEIDHLHRKRDWKVSLVPNEDGCSWNVEYGEVVVCTIAIGDFVDQEDETVQWTLPGQETPPRSITIGSWTDGDWTIVHQATLEDLR